MTVKKCTQTFSLVNATGVAGLVLVVDFEEARWGVFLRSASGNNYRQKEKEITQGTLHPGSYIPFQLEGKWMEIGYNRVSLAHQQELLEMAHHFYHSEKPLLALNSMEHLIDYQLENTDDSLTAGVIFDIKGASRYRELVWTIPDIGQTPWVFGGFILPPKPKITPDWLSLN